ncbi:MULTISPECIES: murein tripeptide amidase MpaA [unclassified Brenneria]|uniref:murein tripeptide amidase MpaA n=1 Tax=unclassified Brenneria TaxID=2634434 RepID=UPI0029C56D8B|nr:MULTISPECIES: murein tripeptide amidase MpaA [unclassified Brenneria]MDX5627008.1 murein tripeptide amidase MpaA [Brenneria sp. L3-3Z]MDX5693642.1 murein tripeptide amidase MpaA [Brenneria sp. L4-2C]
MANNTIALRARHLRGNLLSLGEPYGKSLLGAPLLYFPAELPQRDSGLIIAGTHGEETASIITLSCALRTLLPGQRKHHVVLAVNPDGCQLGLRSNANGVDLNRNFPAGNWRPGDTVYRWNSDADQRDVTLSAGQTPASEPETKALCDLIEKLNPAWVVSFHEPLACIDDPNLSPMGHWLARQFDLPLVRDVGYDTPGSFGSWCADRQLPCVTAELPPISSDAASECYLNAMVTLLCHNFDTNVADVTLN